VLDAELDAVTSSDENEVENRVSASNDNVIDINPPFSQLHDSYIYRPSPSPTPPKYLVNFVGGALAGASPHVFYRLLLEVFARRNYVVVATPFELSFDQLSTADKVSEKFERAREKLSDEYGDLSVICVGHSFGSLAHLLSSSFFPSTFPRRNVLISFNNKNLMDAVPFYDELFYPLFKSVVEKNLNRAVELALRGVGEAGKGEVVSDELLREIRGLVTGEGGGEEEEEEIIPSDVRSRLTEVIEENVEGLEVRKSEATSIIALVTIVASLRFLGSLQNGPKLRRTVLCIAYGIRASVAVTLC